jgi:hypothetical protein
MNDENWRPPMAAEAANAARAPTNSAAGHNGALREGKRAERAPAG